MICIDSSRTGSWKKELAYEICLIPIRCCAMGGSDRILTCLALLSLLLISRKDDLKLPALQQYVVYSYC